MFRTSITTRTATLRLHVRELVPDPTAPGDYKGTFVKGLEEAIKASDSLRGHFDHCDVSCQSVFPDHLVVRYHCGSVHHDVFVSEVKKFIPAVKSYVERWVGRPLQWLEFSFDVATGEANTGYDSLQFDQGFLGMQYQESYMNNNYLNEHVPCNPQRGIEVNTPSHVDTITIINANPGEPNVI